MGYVFISHSTSDNAFTRLLADEMAQAEIPYWVDLDDMAPSQRWPREIEKRIEDSGGMVVVMSRAARDSEWVERETLLAMDRGKPLFVALVEPMPLPLHVINRQYVDCHTNQDTGIRKLLAALRRLKLDSDVAAPQQADVPQLSPTPDQDNFFAYLQQLPKGEDAALIARDLFDWGQRYGDIVDFGGKVTPGFHVRAQVGSDVVTVFSVWAFPKQPAVQVQFSYLMDRPPYDDARLRLSTLHSLNRLTTDEPFIDDKADRRPTLPLPQALDTAEELEYFKQIMAEIIDNLRSV